MEYEKEREIDRLKTKHDESVQRIISEARVAAMLRKLNKELSEHINKHSREEIIDSQIYIVLYYAYNSDGEVIDVFADDMYFPSKDNAITFLLERDYSYVSDDEYSLSRYLHAEIKLLTKEEL